MRLTSLALLAAVPAAVHAAPVPALKRLSVIFAVTVDAEGKVTEVAVSKVIDPYSGSTAALKYEVPAAFVARVRALHEAQRHPKEARTFYTYYFYETGLPPEAQLLPEPKP